MKPGAVYQRFALEDGREVVLRALSGSDLREAVRFVNSLVDERATNRDLGIFLERKVSAREEKRWLAKRVREIRAGTVVSVAAFHRGRLVGNCEVIRQQLSDLSRCGTLGVAILDGFRGVGLGRKMLELLLREARRRGTKLVELRVFSTNRRAVRLYRSLGFRRVGVVPRKIVRDGKYIDEILMLKVQGENR